MGGRLWLVLCSCAVVAVASANDEGLRLQRAAADKVLEPLREHAKDLISMMLQPQGAIGDPQLFGCSCAANYECGCCASFYSAVGCVNVTYIASSTSLNVLLIYNNQVLFNQTISASNPPPICTGLPYKFASWCTVFSNLTIGKDHFGGCLTYQLWILRRKVLELPVGCFSWPPAMQQLALQITSDGCDCLPGKCQCCSQIRMASHSVSERRCIKLIANGNFTTAYLSHAGQIVDKAVIDGSADTRLCSGAFCSELQGVTKIAGSVSGCIMHNLDLIGHMVALTPKACFLLHTE